MSDSEVEIGGGVPVAKRRRSVKDPDERLRDEPKHTAMLHIVYDDGGDDKESVILREKQDVILKETLTSLRLFVPTLTPFAEIASNPLAKGDDVLVYGICVFGKGVFIYDEKGYVDDSIVGRPGVVLDPILRALLRISQVVQGDNARRRQGRSPSSAFFFYDRCWLPRSSKNQSEYQGMS